MPFLKETVSVLVLVVTASAFPFAPASPQSSNLPTSSPVSFPATEPADGVANVLKEGPSSSEEDEGSSTAIITLPIGLTAQLDDPNYSEDDLNISPERVDTYYRTPNKIEKITRLTTKREVQKHKKRQTAAVWGHLKVYIKYGQNLPNRDPSIFGESDPYVKVTAVDDYGRRVRRDTHFIHGNNNPTWNEWLTFGVRAWEHIEMSSWDRDFFSEDRLTSPEKFFVSSGFHENLTHCGSSSCHANVTFDYNLNQFEYN